MLEYIKNLLPRLKRYSKDLDKIENFVDREWVLIDDGGNNQTYEFMRDGRLVMTLVSNNGTNQHTQIGSWDLLGSGRLLITRPQGALTLNQGFLGDKLLILQESGTSNNPFCCYDSTKIKKENIGNYLDDFLHDKENPSIPYPKPILIPERKSKEVLHDIKIFNTNKGFVRIKKTQACSWSAFYPEIKDEVFVEDYIHAADGNYIFKNAGLYIYSMRVSNGRVSKLFTLLHLILFTLFILIVLGLIDDFIKLFYKFFH